MGISPELYIPSKKHWAWHPAPDNPSAAQWWYNEGVFNNGYAVSVVYGATELTGGNFQLDICDPDGNRYTARPFSPIDQVVYSNDTLDVKLGENYLRGKHPRHELHARCDDIGADLVYEAITQEWMEPPDGVYIGRETFPSTTPNCAYVNAVRCKVTGKLIVGGKEIPVEGHGYHDHQWGNVWLWDLFQYWYWGTLHLPNHSVMWWEGMLQSRYGYQRLKWLCVFEGEKLIDYKNDAKFYVEPLDFKEDKKYGIVAPQKVILTIDDERIKGTATYSIKSVLFFVDLVAELRSYFPDLIPPEFQPKGWQKYIRNVSDCDCKFEVDGEKTENHSLAIHEAAV